MWGFFKKKGKSIKCLDISWASFSLRLFCSTHAMALIQHALQSSGLVEAPRCFKHNFWSHRINVRATGLDAFNMMKKSKIFTFFEDFWFFHHVEGVESSPVALKFFPWLQKFCSKHLGASIRPDLCNARWTKAIADVEQKRCNENQAHLMSKDFIDFHIFSDFWFFHDVEGFEWRDSKIFSMTSKMMFKASGDLYNIRALQRTLNENEAHLMSKHFIDFHIFQIFRGFLIFSWCWRCRDKWL